MLRGVPSSKTSPRRGSAAAMVAISLPVLMGVAALGLDAGLLFIQRRQAQTMAEAISTAAAYQLYLSSSNTSGATAAATALASQVWREPHGQYSSHVRAIRQQSGLRSGLDHNQLAEGVQRALGGWQHVGCRQCGRGLRNDPLLDRRNPRAESHRYRGDALRFDGSHRQEWEHHCRFHIERGGRLIRHRTGTIDHGAGARSLRQDQLLGIES